MVTESASIQSSESEIRSFNSYQIDLSSPPNEGLHPIVSGISSLERVRTISSAMSGVSKRVTTTAKGIVSDVRDDNLQTKKSRKEFEKTDLGRILTHLDYNDAIKVATQVEEAEDDNEFLEELATDKQKLAKLADQLQETQLEKEIYPPPDQGYAWVICFSEVLMMIATWGSTTSFGIFISFWLNNEYFPGADATDYALTSSLLVFLAQALAPFASIISNTVGIKPTMFAGSLIHFAGLMLCSYSTKLWQLYCTQGLLAGIGFALVFHPSIVILSSWFLEKRGLSSGIVVSGSGIGGCIFVLAAQKLITDDGDYRWAMRMISIVVIVLELTVTCFLKDRIPKKNDRTWKSVKQQFKVAFNFRVLKRLPVIAISLWFGVGIIAYLVLTYSLSSFSTFIGLSQQTGAHITAIFNGCQAIGRPCIGYMGDRFGKINLALALNIFVAILIFAFWINCNNFITLLFFAILSGLTTGWCQLLNQAMMPDAVPIKLFPAAWAFENIIVGSFCLFVEVVALRLRDMSAPKPFIHAQIFSGCMTLGSFLFLVPVREYKIGNILKARLRETNEKIELNMASSKSISSSSNEKKGSEEEFESMEMLNSRKERYEDLLCPGICGYLKRLTYPIVA